MRSTFIFLALLLFGGCEATAPISRSEVTTSVPLSTPNWDARELLRRAQWLLAGDDLLDTKKIENDLAVRVQEPSYSGHDMASAPILGWLAPGPGDLPAYVYATKPTGEAMNGQRAVLNLSLRSAPCITVGAAARVLTGARSFNLGRLRAYDDNSGPQVDLFVLRTTSRDGNAFELYFPILDGGDVQRCAMRLTLKLAAQTTRSSSP